MRFEDPLSEEARAILDDLVDEMADKNWTERRSLINRVLQVEQAALSLKAEIDSGRDDGRDGPQPAGGRRDRGSGGGLVARLLALALDRLDADEAVCGDSAMVLSISADRRHRDAARQWFAANPGIWERLRPTLH